VLVAFLFLILGYDATASSNTLLGGVKANTLKSHTRQLRLSK